MDETASLEQLVQRAKSRFEERYSRPPQWLAAAPGRVNLIGEHTDYNGGFVLPMAIERYCVIAASATAPATAGRFRLASTSVTEPLEFTTADLSPGSTEHWSDYVRGVVAGCLTRGMQLPGLDLLVESSVPLGGGLSSSAALEVATATLLEAVTGQEIPPLEKALLCQQAEHKYAGMPCGIMDQFSSVMGKQDRLMLLDCRSLEVSHIHLDDSAVTVLIVNSNVKHELTGSEYPTRRAQCQEAATLLQVPELRDATMADLSRFASELEPVHVQRARHVISEIERTQKAAAAISQRDWKSVGTLMYASHESLRGDYEVSCDELDLLVELMHEIGYDGGVWGSRMTGGGFGGCTVSLVRTDSVPSIAERVFRQYEDRTGIRPTIFSSRPAQGARVLR